MHTEGDEPGKYRADQGQYFPDAQNKAPGGPKTLHLDVYQGTVCIGQVTQASWDLGERLVLLNL